MAELAARKSQDDSELGLQSREQSAAGAPQGGERRVTADSFRQLLNRLKKSAESDSPAAPPAPQPAHSAAGSGAHASPVATQRPAEQPLREPLTPTERSIAEPAPEAARQAQPALAVELQAYAAADDVQSRINAVEHQKRERARAEVHAASQEIIARLRKAAASSQQVLAEVQAKVEPVTPPPPAPAIETPASSESVVEDSAFDTAPEPVAQAAPEPAIFAEPAPVEPAPVEPVAEDTASDVLDIAEQLAQLRDVSAPVQPSAAQVEELELSAVMAPVEPVAPAAVVPQATPEPVAATARRRHPFFPDVFVDDDGHPIAPEEATAEPISEPVAVQAGAEIVQQANEPELHAVVEVEPAAPQLIAEAPEYSEQFLVEAAAQLFTEASPAIAEPEQLAQVVAEPEQPAPAADITFDVSSLERPAPAYVQPEHHAVAESLPAPADAQIEADEPVIVEATVEPQPLPTTVAAAPAPAAEVVATPAPTAEVAAAPAPAAEAEVDAGHRDDLIEDEADAVKHLHGVEVKGIGDIARAVFSAPTPAERSAFLAEVAALAPAPSAEAAPKEILAAAPELLAPAKTVRKIAQEDDPFAKIAPDVASFVNNEEPDEDSGELARSLLDMMLSGPHAGLPQERALAADALLKLIPKVPSKALVTIAERISLMEQPPHLLIARLINDPRIEISGPLLEQCNHISDQVIGKVIAGGQISLQRLIARRRHLSPALTDMLIDFDDSSVLLTLVRNAGATFSHVAMNKLVDHASRNDAILAPLATRADLPAPVAFELFWLVPAQLRRYLLSRFLTDSETLSKILKITKVMQNGGTEGEVSDFANKADVESFMEALVNGRHEEAESKLASVAGITQACASRIVGDRQGEPLAIIFKAIGLNRAQFESCLKQLQAPEIGIIDSGRQVLELLSIFNSMSFNKARILLTYWDWAVQKHGPYASAV